MLSLVFFTFSPYLIKLCCLKKITSQLVVAYAFNPSTGEAEAGLVYKVSSMTTRAVTQRDPASTNKNKHIDKTKLSSKNSLGQARLLNG